jgi:hypothetical protein
MKSKLETSIAELHKLKNQIRVELNQIRPSKSPLIIEKREHSAKKIFGSKYAATDIVNPSAEKSRETAKDKKRHFNVESLVFEGPSKSAEKKHFGKHYSDSVSLDNNVRRRTCSYFNIKKEATPSPVKYENTSLTGIGAKDKSNLQQSRLCLRVYRNRLAYNPNFY